MNKIIGELGYASRDIKKGEKIKIVFDDKQISCDSIYLEPKGLDFIDKLIVGSKSETIKTKWNIPLELLDKEKSKKLFIKQYKSRFIYNKKEFKEKLSKIRYWQCSQCKVYHWYQYEESYIDYSSPYCTYCAPEPPKFE